MAILTTVSSLHAIRSAANLPAGGDAESSRPSPPSPRLTRVILPKKKPLKWSTGTAPGEYGGPPTTTKLRQYWGGGDPDPVTSTDDFIWNKDFVGHMKRFLVDEPNLPTTFTTRVEQNSGFLSLNRAMRLDSVGIDLSEELRSPSKSVLEQQVEAARSGRSAEVSPSDAASPRWRLVPTRREQAKWDRASKAATGGTVKFDGALSFSGVAAFGCIISVMKEPLMLECKRIIIEGNNMNIMQFLQASRKHNVWQQQPSIALDLAFLLNFRYFVLSFIKGM